MKKTTSVLVVGALCLFGTVAFGGSARQDSVKRLDSAVDVLHAAMATPDKGIPEEVLSNAKCILVVPNLIKGGFIVGGKHGRGVATCRTSAGWSAPAFVSVGGGSWGLQIGVEDVDLVMLVMNDKGLQHLLSSKFELTGEGSENIRCCESPDAPLSESGHLTLPVPLMTFETVIMDTPACSATVRIVTAVLLRRGPVLLSATIDDLGDGVKRSGPKAEHRQ